MQSVGKFIQAARLQADLSLEEISAQTRISLRNLQAIEEDDLSVAPSAFFYKSFVTQFAKALEIDTDTLAPLIEDMLVRMPAPLVPGQDERLTRGAVIRSSTRPRSYRWLFSVGSLVLALVCCSGFYALWQSQRGDLNRMLGKSDVKATENSSSAGPSESELASGYRVDLSALEPSWLSVTADGKQEFSGMLEPEQKKSFEGHERGRIRTGNAGGISLVFNGKTVGVVGPRGQVRDVVFTKNNYKILPPPSSVSLTSFIQTFELLTPRQLFQR